MRSEETGASVEAAARPASRGESKLPLLWPCALLLALILGKLFIQLSTMPLAIADDQIQHIVPFQSYLPENPLPRDEIVDFFIGENSQIMRGLYAFPAMLGFQPTSLAWFVGLLCGLLSLFFIHAIMRSAGASATAAAATTILLLVYLATRNDLPTGSSRALAWPVMLACLWALVAEKRLLFALAASVGAVIYPTVAVIALTAAALARLSLAFAERKAGPLLSWWAVPVVPALLLLSWLGDSEWGPTISAELARQSPEFLEGGRTKLFVDNSLAYYLTGNRTGLVEAALRRLPFIPLLAAAAFFFFAKPPPALQRLTLAVAAASLLLWAAAHLLLFKLYLPSRYPIFGLQLSLVMLAGYALGEAVDRWKRGRAAVLLLLLGWPLVASFFYFPHFGLRSPDAPGLVRSIAASSEPGRVAGLSKDLNYVPRFTNRSVYWSYETALPYKTRYRDFIASRLQASVASLFSPDPTVLLGWAAQEKVAFILIDEAHLMPGPMPSLVAGAPGGSDPSLPARSDWPKSWLARQGNCAQKENGVLLFRVSCLRGAPSGA